VSFDFFESDGQVFPLSGGREPIVLRSDGMDHPVNARSRRRVVTKYEDITHLATTNQAAWVASRKSLYILPRSLFAQTGGPENLLRALARRIAERPGSEAQLARMAAIERLSTARRPLRATLGLAVLCLAVFCAQLFGGESVFLVGNFSEGFFFAGDTWRVITANLLHAAPQFPIHLGLNMIALVILGALVERPLGAARTIAIMGASGVTAMLATTVAETAPVVGASGMEPANRHASALTSSLLVTAASHSAPSSPASLKFRRLVPSFSNLRTPRSVSSRSRRSRRSRSGSITAMSQLSERVRANARPV